MQLLISAYVCSERDFTKNQPKKEEKRRLMWQPRQQLPRQRCACNMHICSFTSQGNVLRCLIRFNARKVNLFFVCWKTLFMANFNFTVFSVKRVNFIKSLQFY